MVFSSSLKRALSRQAAFKRSALYLLAIAAVLTVLYLSGCSPSQSETDNVVDRMAQGHQNDHPVATIAASMEPAVPVSTQQIQYATVDGNPVTGYLAQPESASDPLPAIIAIHEWWGLNDNIRAMTERLAGEGYTVLAVDLYGDRTADSSSNARQLMQTVMRNPDAARSNLRQAYQYLAEEQSAPEVGVIGWCFGGGWALQTALLLPEALDAAVIYYGELVTDPAELRTLEMPVLGIFGAEDQVVPLEKVREFESTLNSLDKTAEIYVYEDAGHAFANPSGEQYLPSAAADAWEKTINFLNQYLGEASVES